MSLKLARTVDESIARGTDKTIWIQVIDDLDEVNYNMSGHSIYLTMSSSDVSEEPTISKKGEVYAPSSGVCRFFFVPEDTEDKLAVSYDASIFVENNETKEKWPAFKGKIAITPNVMWEEE